MILELIASGVLQTHPSAPPKLVNIKPTIQNEITIEKPLEPVSYEIIEEATYLPVPTPTAVTAPTSASYSTAKHGTGTLTGSIGSVSPYGNCVNEPGVNRGIGNPSNWPALTRTPSIGATALWTYNHTGVVTGIWDNGDIEVRHQNFDGSRTRFSISEFRGFR